MRGESEQQSNSHRLRVDPAKRAPRRSRSHSEKSLVLAPLALAAAEGDEHGALRRDARRLARREPRPVFIVDDLVTSGASAREAIRALQAVNIRVAGLISACAVSPN